MSETSHIFLDTNYFLHFQMCDQIDWCELTGHSCILLVVTPVVFRELNEKKDGKNANRIIRERATDRIRFLLPLVGGGRRSRLRKNVEITAIPYDPVLNFVEHRLHTHLADDWLLASIIEYKRETTQSKVVLATDDAGLKLKAPAHGIEVFDLPFELRFSDPEEEQDKQIRVLNQELNLLKGARPAIRLAFADEKNFAALQCLKRGTAVDKQEKQWDREEQQRQIRKLTGGVIDFGLMYSDKVLNQKFPAELEEYLDCIQRTFLLQAYIFNSGKVPAIDISIQMDFPTEGVLLADKVPKSPSVYKDKLPSINPIELLGKEESSVQIVGSVARFQLKSAMHHMRTSLKPLYITLSKESDLTGLKLVFGAVCSNLHDLVDGELHIRFASNE